MRPAPECSAVPARGGRRSARYPADVIRHAIHEVVVEGRAIRSVADEIGGSHEVVRTWIRRSRLDELTDRSAVPSAPTERVTQETAGAVIVDWIRGLTIVELAEMHHISRQRVQAILAQRGRALRRAPGGPRPAPRAT